MPGRGAESDRTRPRDCLSYDSLITCNLFLERTGEAERAWQRAASRNVTIRDVPLFGYHLAFLRGDRAEMDRQAAAARTRPGGDDLITHAEALVLARAGRLQLAASTSRQAVDIAERAGHHETAAIYEAAAAAWNAFFGEAATARQHAAAALQLSKGRDAEYAAAVALALAGDITQAQGLAADLEKRYPEDTCVQSSYLPTLRALISLHAGQPSQAIEQLEIARTYEFADPAISFLTYFGSLYRVRARRSVPGRAQERRSRGGVSENSRSPRTRPRRRDGRARAAGAGPCVGRVGRHRQSEGGGTRIFSRSGRTRIPRSRFSTRLARKTPGCTDCVHDFYKTVRRVVRGSISEGPSGFVIIGGMKQKSLLFTAFTIAAAAAASALPSGPVVHAQADDLGVPGSITFTCSRPTPMLPSRSTRRISRARARRRGAACRPFRTEQRPGAVHESGSAARDVTADRHLALRLECGRRAREARRIPSQVSSTTWRRSTRATATSS